MIVGGEVCASYYDLKRIKSLYDTTKYRLMKNDLLPKSFYERLEALTKK